MADHDETRWLNYAEAAHRVRRSERNIRRWRSEGMVMGWRTGSDGQRERVVREEVLLAWWRDRMDASPVHQARMRRLAREDGLPEPVRRVVPRKPQHTPTSPTPSDEPRPAPVIQIAELRGGPEYGELQRALEHSEPGCRDVAAFTADRITNPATLAAICAACPVLAQCRAFAVVSRPAGGYWPVDVPAVAASRSA